MNEVNKHFLNYSHGTEFNISIIQNFSKQQRVASTNKLLFLMNYLFKHGCNNTDLICYKEDVTHWTSKLHTAMWGKLP
jgi:hypothetical protein